MACRVNIEPLQLPVHVIQTEENLQAVAVRDLQAEMLGQIDLLNLETRRDQRILMRMEQVERGVDFLAVRLLPVGQRATRVAADQRQISVLRSDFRGWSRMPRASIK